MLRVFIALGKQMPKEKVFIDDVQTVAKLLAKYGCTMVQGGAKIGLMGLAVQEFQKYSDDVVMIVPEAYKSDLVGANCKESYIVEGESDRMRITIHTCDMMIVLPGGSGTLAELAYYNETRKSGEHNSRIVVVNSKGFYNKLFKFHKHQIKHGLMKAEDCKFDVIKTAKDLEPILQEVITKKKELQMEEQLKKQKEVSVEKVEDKSKKPVKSSSKANEVKIKNQKNSAKNKDSSKKDNKKSEDSLQKKSSANKSVKPKSSSSKKSKSVKNA